MPDPLAVIAYEKCRPENCDKGICAAVLACPNKVLIQEAAYEFPFANPSHFCRGCAQCTQACLLGAIRVV